MRPASCDLFCRVVDNFGDIGVCWRLSRQLANEYGVRTRLIVDDLASFQRIAPSVVTGVATQRVAGVEVLHWQPTLQAGSPADLVIEAFACELPDAYQPAMAQRIPAPVWVNLEYLSAETWVESHHLLPSPHPRLPLVKHFFLPGFTTRTGGLIRESTVAVPGAEPADVANSKAPLRVFVFCYESAPVEALATGAERAGVALRISTPIEAVLAKLQHWRASQANSGWNAAPMLEFDHCEFVAQEAFDAALAAQDVLFVRGEDSFVRAQWAAKPFVWQIYPQESGAHWQKLDAFLDLYCVGLDPAPAAALRSLWLAWNGAPGADAAAAWIEFLRWRPILLTHARDWAQRLMQVPDLVSNLLSFYQKIAKI